MYSLNSQNCLIFHIDKVCAVHTFLQGFVFIAVSRDSKKTKGRREKNFKKRFWCFISAFEAN